MKTLIIANARWKGGLSGSDNIYLHFFGYWSGLIHKWEMLEIDFKPFWACYSWRIIRAIFKAVFCFQRYDFVYSASDFLMDSIPGFIMKLKGNKWIAGFYLYAPKENKPYYYSQKIAYFLIKHFADIVCITNNSMKWGFENKKTVAIHGGIDLSLAYPMACDKKYDAVFCGRIHPTKGIDDLIRIWRLVRINRPQSRLAIIGDGDLGIGYVKDLIGKDDLGIDLLGYMGEERFNVFRNSKVVLYPTPLKYWHFSMSPVEAMACGCPMVCYWHKDLKHIFNLVGDAGAAVVYTDIEFAKTIRNLLKDEIEYKKRSEAAIQWARIWDWRYMTRRVYSDFQKGLTK